MTSWATTSFSRNTVLHGDGVILECGATAFILSQTSGAAERWLSAVHTFTCCPIPAASGPPSPASEIALGGRGGGCARHATLFVFFRQSKGPRKSTCQHRRNPVIFPSLASNVKTVTQTRKGSERQLSRRAHDLKHQTDKTTLSTTGCTAQTTETQHNYIRYIFMSVITNIHELLTMSVAQITRVVSMVG